MVGICPIKEPDMRGGEINYPEPQRWRVTKQECELQPPGSKPRALSMPRCLRVGIKLDVVEEITSELTLTKQV